MTNLVINHELTNWVSIIMPPNCLASLNPSSESSAGRNDAIRMPHSRIFSLNVIHQTRLSKPRAKKNCRSIEIPLIIPCSSPTPISSNMVPKDPCLEQDQKLASATDIEKLSSRDNLETEPVFPFLSLPAELRLRIYALLLPSRTHTIVTQYPYNGYYYSGTSIVSHSTQTLYPAQPYSCPPPPETQQNFTTYKLLNANFHRNFPNPSICTEILRTSKQIREEAEPVLYGAKTVFDFGVYIDAVVPFLKDRSELARRTIRHVRLAREIPVMLSAVVRDGGMPLDSDPAPLEAVDPLWGRTCSFLRDQCVCLRTFDLTVWAEDGGLVEGTPPTVVSTPDAQDMELTSADGGLEEESKILKPIQTVDDRKQRRNWDWTRALLKVEALRHVKVTWWGFTTSKAREAKFDSWLRRMVADKLVKDRMVCDGRIVEGVFLVPGDWNMKVAET